MCAKARWKSEHMAYLWYQEETAQTQALGWSAISRVLKLSSFPGSTTSTRKSPRPLGK